MRKFRGAKQAMAFILALLLVFSLMPVGTLAAELPEGTQQTTVAEEIETATQEVLTEEAPATPDPVPEDEAAGL
ncbi:MAG: hypothetical protein Q4C22_06955, partial [Bacillota bacterium]|nr:hypothetical protein [Bacillota bacterium]